MHTYCTYTRTVLTHSLTCNNSPLLSATISAIIFCISPLLLLPFSPSLLLIIFTLFSACVHSAVSPPNSLRHTAKFNGIEGRGGKGGEREIEGGEVYREREEKGVEGGEGRRDGEGGKEGRKEGERRNELR